MSKNEACNIMHFKVTLHYKVTLGYQVLLHIVESTMRS